MLSAILNAMDWSRKSFYAKLITQTDADLTANTKMTFSVAARCDKTGMFGLSVSSSSPAVAARCAFARAGVGSASSQNITDPALGSRCLDLMQSGASAQEAIDTIVSGTNFIEYRQLTAVDKNGMAASYLGVQSLGVYSQASDKDIVCAGNLLDNESVPQRMVESFNKTKGQALGNRLLTVMQAALDAGGEAGPVHSAGLLLVDTLSWPVADLRVDWHDNAEPIQQLKHIWDIYSPQLNDYVIRAGDPASAPSYGVPGDD